MVRLFAFTFDIDVPYCEVFVDEDDKHHHSYFVCPSSGYYLTTISYLKSTHKINNSMKDYRYCMIHHLSYIDPSSNANKRGKERLKKFKMLPLKNRNDELHVSKFTLPWRTSKEPLNPTPKPPTPYYINGINISNSGIVPSNNSKLANSTRKKMIL